MQKMALADIIKTTCGTALKSGAALNLTGICTDTRVLKPGQTYLALKGPNFDGNKFIAAALAKKAAGVISSAKPSPAELKRLGFAILVPDTLKALQQIAALYRSKFNIPVIAITGSNGKTTTKEMTGRILKKHYRALVTAGNFNNQVGVPLTLLQLNKKHQAAVLELGTSGLGEIANLAGICRPDIGVITGIGHSHLSHLKSLGTVLKAKMELIDNLSAAGIAVLNNDDPYLAKNIPKLKTRVITFGLKPGAMVSATSIRTVCGRQQVQFVLRYKGQKVPVMLNTLGVHNVYNALAAAGAALAMNISLREIAGGLNDFRPVSGRLRVIKRGSLTVIDDSYNANPDSVKAALRTLDNYALGRRKIAVLGDMLELGKYSLSCHREVGKIVGQLGVDMLYTIGTHSRALAQAARQQGLPGERVRVFNLGEEELLARELKLSLRSGDIVLVKASHSMHLDKVVEKITH
jgi:UDP-N-acetylmuramoyl-tripeptide--D-alanyl-D-alanine ligase